MGLIRSRQKDIDIPNLDILTFLFDSHWGLAKEDTRIHVEAANPFNFITKSDARRLVKQIAYILRYVYGIGASRPGADAIVVTSSGNPFVPCLFYSIVAAGGVYSGASTAFQTNELIRQVKDADAKLLICSPEYQAKNVEAANYCGIPLDRVVVLDCTTPNRWRLLRSTDGSDVLSRGETKLLDWPRLTTREDVESITTCLLYSSGTTGLPKGVRLSHLNLVASTLCTMSVSARHKERCQLQGREFVFSTLAHLPMAHIAGIDMYSVNPFHMGGTTYWMKGYDFDSFIKYHRQYRPSFQFSVPPIWLQVAKSPKVTDHFDGIEVAQSGAAPMGRELANEVRARLGKGKVWLVQTYGITEATGSVAAMDWTLEDETFSVGDLCPNVRLRLVNEDGYDVENGRPGELWIGGPIVAQGYHNRPDANSDAFTDGFYRTGDIGIYQKGLLYIVDRKKELIKYKGTQVAPAELEALLVSHPKINDAAVIGIQDDRQGTELPRAYVVVKPAEKMTAEEVANFVKNNLSKHKQLRGGVIFLESIPKSPSGKILRKELRLSAEQEKRAKL